MRFWIDGTLICKVMSEEVTSVWINLLTGALAEREDVRYFLSMPQHMRDRLKKSLETAARAKLGPSLDAMLERERARMDSRLKAWSSAAQNIRKATPTFSADEKAANRIARTILTHYNQLIHEETERYHQLSLCIGEWKTCL